jgi:hypothetical protein
MSFKSKLAGALLKSAKKAGRDFADKATSPEVIARVKAAIQNGTASPGGEAIAKRLDEASLVSIQHAKQRAEAERLELEAKKKRMRWIGAIEAIGGSIALIALLAFVVFCWQNEDWQVVLGSKLALVIAVGLIVSAGLIITGIRTLFTARG